jgi:serine phosphatase RsbU (regulator of sigma subunit)
MWSLRSSLRSQIHESIAGRIASLSPSAPENRFDQMEAQGLPLGISPEFLSEPPQALQFAPGELQVLTTDGFFEWANASVELFGS